MNCLRMIQLRDGSIVPCGKCPACLANQRSEWIFRLQQEYLVSSFSIFVTLTYDDDHLPSNSSVNKRDVQLFHKRLRKHFPSADLRYYLVSEYGDHTFRPHYHGLYFFKGNYDKTSIYKIFEESWQNGFCKFGEVEEGSIVYCTKYCLKHSSTPSGRIPTFRLVSKMHGGLGINYLDKMKDFHELNQQFSFAAYNGKTFRMPRYLRSKMFDTRNKYVLSAEQSERVLNEFNKRYQDYLYSNDLKDCEESRRQFNTYNFDRVQRIDDLIIKHCKKQKM